MYATTLVPTAANQWRPETRFFHDKKLMILNNQENSLEFLNTDVKIPWLPCLFQ